MEIDLSCSNDKKCGGCSTVCWGLSGWGLPGATGTACRASWPGVRTAQEEEDVGSRDLPAGACAGPAARALFGKSLRWPGRSGCELRGSCAAHARPPGLCTQPLGRTVADWGRKIPGVGPRLWGPPSEPSPRTGAGSPGFCLYMAERRRRHSVGPEALC